MKDTIVRSVKESQVMVDKADERLRREVAEKGKRLRREIAITNRQIELQQASTEKSLKLLDHCLKVGRIAETAGFIFIGLCIVSAFFGRPAIVIIFGLLANVSIWGAVGYDSFMNHQDNKRQAEVDRQIAELEKQKEGD